jgi:hypothetical protein
LKELWCCLLQACADGDGSSVTKLRQQHCLVFDMTVGVAPRMTDKERDQLLVGVPGYQPGMILPVPALRPTPTKDTDPAPTSRSNPEAAPRRQGASAPSSVRKRRARSRSSHARHSTDQRQTADRKRARPTATTTRKKDEPTAPSSTTTARKKDEPTAPSSTTAPDGH